MLRRTKLRVLVAFADILLICSCHGWLGGTTGSASDQRSEGCGFEAYYKVVCITVLTGNRSGVNYCPLWPVATPSSEL